MVGTIDTHILLAWELPYATCVALKNKTKTKTTKKHILFFCFFFFRATPQAHGGFQAGVELELQLPAYATATSTLNP